MKTVFRSKEIAHIWANRGASFGRSPGNLSFDGDSISSYATVIGRRIEARGKTAYVLDRASFSNSTSKSQSRVASALPQSETVFHIREGRRGQSLRFTPITLAAWYETRAASLAGEMPSRYARIRCLQWQAVTDNLMHAREVLAFFGYGTARLDRKIASRKAGDATAADRLLADRKKREQAKLARDKKDLAEKTARNIKGATEFVAGIRPESRVDLTQKTAALDTLPEALRARFVAAVAEHNAAIDAREAKENAEKLAAWISGEAVNLPYSCPTMLRAENAEMVTSHGARVPLEDAARTYRFILKARAAGWHRNGDTHQIGSYHLDAVNDCGVVAGCHRVTWAEIERFAALMGWKGGAA